MTDPTPGRFHGLPVHHPVQALDRGHPLPPEESAASRCGSRYVAVGE